jgi:hypothetical protein
VATPLPNGFDQDTGALSTPSAHLQALLGPKDRHRAALADALRRAIENVRDAEFTEAGCDQAPA